jgi:glycosyltransferase involved in cell wall biosynthesis
MSSTGSLKLLHVAETIRGGIATYLNELHPLQAMDFGLDQIRYVVPVESRTDLKSVPDAAVYGFRRTGRNPLSLWRMAVATVRAVRAFRPEVVHLHSSFAGIVLRPMLRVAAPRVRIVYCAHGWAFSRETTRPSRVLAAWIERLLAPLCDRIVCISSSEHRAALDAGLPAAKLALVRSGISAARQPVRPVRWEDPRLRVLFVGRLDRQKGYDLLIEAARRLPETVQVRIIGSAVVGELPPLDLPENVEILGWQNHEAIEAHLDQADVAVVPSRWEGFGLVTLEAMRAGKPVIAFAAGALTEIVQDGVTGFICAPIGVDALVEGIQRAASAPLREMGQAGYDRLVQQFRVEHMDRKLNAVYRQVATPRPASAEQEA